MITQQPESATDTAPARWSDAWRGGAEWLAVSALFILLTLWYTDPLWRHPASYVPDLGDSLHNVSVAWWLSNKLLSGHWSGFWSLPPYFYPARLPLAYDDPQIGATLLGLPVFAATGSVVAAFNAVILVSFPLCALGAYVLARHVTGSRAGALVAALVWGFGAWRAGHYGHQQLLSLECLPWILLALHRYAETQRRRCLLGLFLLWVAQEYLCEYWGAFLILLIVPFALILLRGCAGLTWRATGAALAAIALAVVAWLPAQWPFLVLASHGIHHSMNTVNMFSADLADYAPVGTWLTAHTTGRIGEFWVSPGLPALVLAGLCCRILVRSERRAPAPERGVPTRVWETAARLAPLLVLVATAALAVMRVLGVKDLLSFGLPARWVNADSAIRLLLLAILLWANAPLRAWLRGLYFPVTACGRYSPLLAYAALALLAMAWSCGYEICWNGEQIMPGPHGLLTWLPGTRGFRVLARMGIFADLALAVLVAATVAAGMNQWRARGGRPWQRGLAAGALALLALSDNVPRGGLPFASSHPIPRPRAVDAWLAAQPTAPLVELPMVTESARMWAQTRHRKPMVNGYATFGRPGYGDDARLLTVPQSSRAIARLRALGVHYIVVDQSDGAARALQTPYSLAYTDSDVKVYTLKVGTLR